MEEIEGEQELIIEFPNGCKIYAVRQDSIVMECDGKEYVFSKTEINMFSKILDF